jgi:hypothetical protein
MIDWGYEKYLRRHTILGFTPEFVRITGPFESLSTFDSPIFASFVDRSHYSTSLSSAPV